jgi:predicted glycogen debranching enzyme
MLDWGRELARDLGAAESREWLCTNGRGGFASGTIASVLTRRYHGLLIAALAPPLGRTLLVSKVEDVAEYEGQARALSANRWASGSVDPRGYCEIERFRLEGAIPVWTYALGEARLSKRIWMEQGANTTYVRYTLERARGPVALTVRALVNYRDDHGTTRGDGWRMGIESIPHGVRVVAFAGARPFVLLAPGSQAEPAHTWYEGFRLAREAERGLDSSEDHLHAATFRATLEPGGSWSLVCSAEASPALDGEAAWRRRRAWEAELDRRGRRAVPRSTPPWIPILIRAADQFLVRRPTGQDPDGVSVIAGYHWFGDWGRDTMVSLPGLTLATGRPEFARKILTTWAGFVDGGMLPNRFPDAGGVPEYDSVDAALWYVEAVRAYVAATGDQETLARLAPALEEIMGAYRRGTRYGIAEDPADGLVRAGAPGRALTWMDARVGDTPVTPRVGKAVEVNALWCNALAAMRAFAERLGRPVGPWEASLARTRTGFDRFWNEAAGYCFDVLDGPGGADASLRPNQILAVSLPASPLTPDRQRRVVEACARALLTSCGLRSLSPADPHYRGRYMGNPEVRDGAYHQGTVWAWLLGPFALAHFRVYGDRGAALGFLEPLAHTVGDYGLGSLAEIFDGDPPCEPRGCIAQAWSVAETLRAWLGLQPTEAPGRATRRGAATPRVPRPKGR